MARTDNYLIQAQQAKSCFLTYNAEALAKKLNAKLDADFLYTTFSARATGSPGKPGISSGWKTARGRTETAMRRS